VVKGAIKEVKGGMRIWVAGCYIHICLLLVTSTVEPEPYCNKVKSAIEMDSVVV
jgi:hypothetical protein